MKIEKISQWGSDQSITVDKDVSFVVTFAADKQFLYCSEGIVDFFDCEKLDRVRILAMFG
jgi:hypothetical protein